MNRMNPLIFGFQDVPSASRQVDNSELCGAGLGRRLQYGRYRVIALISGGSKCMA